MSLPYLEKLYTFLRHFISRSPMKCFTCKKEMRAWVTKSELERLNKIALRNEVEVKYDTNKGFAENKAMLKRLGLIA